MPKKKQVVEKWKKSTPNEKFEGTSMELPGKLDIHRNLHVP